MTTTNTEVSKFEPYIHVYLYQIYLILPKPNSDNNNIIKAMHLHTFRRFWIGKRMSMYHYSIWENLWQYKFHMARYLKNIQII